MNFYSKILVTGANGMVGKNLISHLTKDYNHVIPLTRTECDLEDRNQTLNFFKTHQPDFVFHLAAKVGGINANISDPVGFLNSNALINCHVLEACKSTNVKKTLILGSSCIYPRLCPQPMKEDYLTTGPLEPTNEGYALSKILAISLAKAYNSQFGMSFVCPLPSNIYGPGDTFDLKHSHVLSALVRRFVDAKKANLQQVQLWGSGSAKREFIHVNDVVRSMLFFIKNINDPSPINVGPGSDISIKDLAGVIANLVGYNGKIEWDLSKPDGMPRKCMDVSKINSLGFKVEVDLIDGIKEVIAEYTRISK